MNPILGLVSALTLRGNAALTAIAAPASNSVRRFATMVSTGMRGSSADAGLYYDCTGAARDSASGLLPDHHLAHAAPMLEVPGEEILDAVALDLQGRRDQVIVHGPGVGHHHEAVELLVRIQGRVDRLQMLGERALELAAGRGV